jgi:ferrous iron transport protein A
MSVSLTSHGTASANIVTKLDQLPSGEHATILALHAEAALERRLLALGLRPGQAVCLLRRGLMNGPLHVRVGTTELMLRRQEAQHIDITRADAT